MKQFLQYSVRLLLLIGAVTLFFACEEGPNFQTYTYPPQKASALSPSSGFPGDRKGVV